MGKKKVIKKVIKYSFLIGLIILLVGLIVPQNLNMPVEGATSKDYHPQSFWAYPWGKSGTHKGVDVFGSIGTPIHSPVRGVVLKSAYNAMGGNYILILGPKWRVHYLAHLSERKVKVGKFVNQKTTIGLLGDSGNAKGKPAHLHYSIVSILPRPWKMDDSVQGWKKAFYVNPIQFF